jgi:hypothetical protein
MAMLKLFRGLAALSAGASLLQVGSCVGDALQVIGDTNPCGAILNCNPRAWEFVTSGIDGPGVRPEIDPFCTFAPFCNAAQDPIFGGLANPANP